VHDIYRATENVLIQPMVDEWKIVSKTDENLETERYSENRGQIRQNFDHMRLLLLRLLLDYIFISVTVRIGTRFQLCQGINWTSVSGIKGNFHM
jgi:hypothetical protein